MGAQVIRIQVANVFELQPTGISHVSHAFGRSPAEACANAEVGLRSLGAIGAPCVVASRIDSTNTVQAERVHCDIPTDLGTEALAMPPQDIEVSVPEDWRPGDKVPAQGPHGRVLLVPSDRSTPGSVFRHRLKPAPEFCVEVPPG